MSIQPIFMSFVTASLSLVSLFQGNGTGDDAVVKALASHHCGPGSNPSIKTMCGLSLLLVLSFPPRGFSPGTPVFPSPQKPTFPNSNYTRNQVDKEPLCGCATSKSLFIYLFIYHLRRLSEFYLNSWPRKYNDSVFRYFKFKIHSLISLPLSRVNCGCLLFVCRYNYSRASRTLCPFLHSYILLTNGSVLPESFSVDVSTFSPKPVNYTLKADFVDNFVLM